MAREAEKVKERNQINMRKAIEPKYTLSIYLLTFKIYFSSSLLFSNLISKLLCRA